MYRYDEINYPKLRPIHINIQIHCAPAQMVASARQYINNEQFLNLLQNIDINDANVKNKNKTTSIYWVSAQLAAFNGVPELSGQVDT